MDKQYKHNNINNQTNKQNHISNITKGATNHTRRRLVNASLSKTNNIKTKLFHTTLTALQSQT